jgi:hypothetical protein
MKKCGRCQSENFDDQKFCSLCGKELTQPVSLDLYAPGTLPVREVPEPAPLLPEQRAYQHFLEAKDQIQQRNLDRAIEEFQSALRICPGDPMITRLLKKTQDALQRAGATTRRGPPSDGADRATGSRSTGPTASAPGAPEGRAGAFGAAPARAGTPRTSTAPGGSTMSRAPAVPVAPVTFSTLANLSSRDSPYRPAPALPVARPEGARAPSAPARGRPTARAGASRSTVPPGEAAPAPARAHELRPVEPPEDRPAPHTGRFLELYARSPSLSPSLVMDGRSEEGMREVAVNLLILGGFLTFGLLLLLVQF